MPRVGLTPTDQERADTFTRLLDALQEGVFVGVLNPGTSEPGRTVVANPALKRLFGLPRRPRMRRSIRLRRRGSPTWPHAPASWIG